ncbi:MAG: hypothetical protein WD601_12065 [Pseudohongiellaceae bacterium]
MKNMHYIRSFYSSLLGSGLLLLAGCGVNTINISGAYPSPLVSKLPLTVGVYYDETLSSFSYTEINDNTGKDQLIVNSGPSQIDLFNTVLPAVFENVVLLENLDGVSARDDLDAVFVPVIEEFQLGLPQKTRLSVYEIWIKYNMRLSRANGDYIADWVMTAYGKSPEEGFQSTDEGVNNAAVVALRDLAASFALGFTSIPEVNDWLKERSLLDE